MKLTLVECNVIYYAMFMQSVQFEKALERALKRDKRFEAEAFELLREALDYTTHLEHEASVSPSRHVSAEQLLLGFRDYVLKEYGPMGMTLLNEWGIKCCADIGDMVFLLIEEGAFSKQDGDSKEDFREVYDFKSTFVEPYLPA